MDLSFEKKATTIVERIIDSSISKPEEMIGCSEEEIKKLEKTENINAAQKSPADAARDAVVEWRTLQIDLLTARLGHTVLLIVTLL